MWLLKVSRINFVLLTELLIESIADVMSRIRTQNKHRLSNLSQLNGQRAAARRLANTAFA